MESIQPVSSSDVMDALSPASAIKPVYQEFVVHHSTVDGILVELPASGGFGRLNKASFGGDALGEALWKHFSVRPSIPAILTRKKDAHGYRILSVHIKESWSELWSYTASVRQLLPTLARKHLMHELGSTMLGRLRKSTPKGLILEVGQRVVALAVQIPRASAASVMEEGEELEVRVLNYDVSANVLNVAVESSVTEMPLFTEAAGLQVVQPGDWVDAEVLLSTTEDQCAVVAVRVGEGASQHRLLGYYMYTMKEQDEKVNKSASASATPPPALGAKLRLRVEFVPESKAVQDAAPFLLLSHRQHTSPLPAVRSPSITLFTPPVGLRGAFNWRAASTRHVAGETESDEDDEEEHGAVNERIRRRKMEEAVDAYERRMLEETPSSPEAFQRLLLATPNSSYLWTQYMAYHVKLQQVEEARQIAEKALQRISPTEETESRNVWVSYLNLENMYGTGESLNAVFKRALSYQAEPLRLYESLADIFSASHKSQQLLELCRTMTSKWPHSPSTWERLGRVLLDQNKGDQLKRMIKSVGENLKKDEAAMVVVRLASQQLKQGSVEEGRALFEGLLSKVPKKSDVWLAFVDQEISLLGRKAPKASLMSVRNVFDRATAMNFTPKVMQLLFSKYMNFEKQYGTPKDVERVKQRAREYVESKVQAIGEQEAAGASAAV